MSSYPLTSCTDGEGHHLTYMISLCVLQAAVLESTRQRGFRAEGGEGAEDLL